MVYALLYLFVLQILDRVARGLYVRDDQPVYKVFSVRLQRNDLSSCVISDREGYVSSTCLLCWYLRWYLYSMTRGAIRVLFSTKSKRQWFFPLRGNTRCEKSKFLSNYPRTNVKLRTFSYQIFTGVNFCEFSNGKLSELCPREENSLYLALKTFHVEIKLYYWIMHLWKLISRDSPRSSIPHNRKTAATSVSSSRAQLIQYLFQE